jgi:hypothetical protein
VQHHKALEPLVLEHKPALLFSTHLQRIAPIGLSVNHLHDILMNKLSCLIPISPIIRSPYTVFANEEIFRVVDILIRA